MAEDALKKAHNELEIRVEDRTRKLRKEIEDRERFEDALSKSEGQLRLITDNVPVLISYVDRELRYQFNNKAYEEWFGVFPNEIKGKLVEEVIGEDYKKFRKYSMMALSGKRVDYEDSVKDKDGITRDFWANYVPDFGPDKEVQGFFVLVKDITDRKKAEEELRLQAEIINNMAEGTHLIRFSDGTIIYANPRFEHMFGYEPGELNGKHVSILNDRTDKTQDKIVDDVFESLGKHGFWKGEVRNVKKDGTPLCCYVTVSTFKHPRYGNIAITVQTDISERKRAEEALKKAYNEMEVRVKERTQELSDEISERKGAEDKLKISLKEKEVLFKEIHHRVKNNLQLISSMLNLQSMSIDSKEIRDKLKVSKDRIRTMALIHEKLYQSENFSMVDISDYIKSLSISLLQSYGMRSSDFKLNIEIERTFINIDTAILCGLIINELISNSTKHAFKRGKKGEIKINLLSDNGKLTLTLSDNGKGLPKDVDIQDPKTLGLQLVTDLCAQLNGSMDLDRSNGTTFNFTFPQ